MDVTRETLLKWRERFEHAANRDPQCPACLTFECDLIADEDISEQQLSTAYWGGYPQAPPELEEPAPSVYNISMAENSHFMELTSPLNRNERFIGRPRWGKPTGEGRPKSPPKHIPGCAHGQKAKVNANLGALPSLSAPSLCAAPAPPRVRWEGGGRAGERLRQPMAVFRQQQGSFGPTSVTSGTVPGFLAPGELANALESGQTWDAICEKASVTSVGSGGGDGGGHATRQPARARLMARNASKYAERRQKKLQRELQPPPSRRPRSPRRLQRLPAGASGGGQQQRQQQQTTHLKPKPVVTRERSDQIIKVARQEEQHRADERAANERRPAQTALRVARTALLRAEQHLVEAKSTMQEKSTLLHDLEMEIEELEEDICSSAGDKGGPRALRLRQEHARTQLMRTVQDHAEARDAVQADENERDMRARDASEAEAELRAVDERYATVRHGLQSPRTRKMLALQERLESMEQRLARAKLTERDLSDERVALRRVARQRHLEAEGADDALLAYEGSHHAMEHGVVEDEEEETEAFITKLHEREQQEAKRLADDKRAKDMAARMKARAQADRSTKWLLIAESGDAGNAEAALASMEAAAKAKAEKDAKRKRKRKVEVAPLLSLECLTNFFEDFDPAKAAKAEFLMSCHEEEEIIEVLKTAYGRSPVGYIRAKDDIVVEKSHSMKQSRKDAILRRQVELAEVQTGEMKHRLADIEVELSRATEDRENLEAQEHVLRAKRDALLDAGPPGPAAVAKRHHDARAAHVEAVVQRKRLAKEREDAERRAVEEQKASARSRRHNPDPTPQERLQEKRAAASEAEARRAAAQARAAELESQLCALNKEQADLVISRALRQGRVRGMQTRISKVAQELESVTSAVARHDPGLMSLRGNKQFGAKLHASELAQELAAGQERIIRRAAKDLRLLNAQSKQVEGSFIKRKMAADSAAEVAAKNTAELRSLELVARGQPRRGMRIRDPSALCHASAKSVLRELVQGHLKEPLTRAGLRLLLSGDLGRIQAVHQLLCVRKHFVAWMRHVHKREVRRAKHLQTRGNFFRINFLLPTGRTIVISTLPKTTWHALKQKLCDHQTLRSAGMQPHNLCLMWGEKEVDDVASLDGCRFPESGSVRVRFDD
jgi:hypothetical protein